MTDKQPMEAEEMLRELASLEKPLGMNCNIPACNCGETHATVPAFPMLRVECDHQSHKSPGVDHRAFVAHRKKCPGWRAKTLDEARLCLEELLVAALGDGKKAFVNWLFAAWDGANPTEAVIAALYEASKVKI